MKKGSFRHSKFDDSDHARALRSELPPGDLRRYIENQASLLESQRERTRFDEHREGLRRAYRLLLKFDEHSKQTPPHYDPHCEICVLLNYIESVTGTEYLMRG